MLALCLSLACGKVTTPGGQGGVTRDRDEDDTSGQPSQGGSMQNAMDPDDADPPPPGGGDPGDCSNVTVAGVSVTLGGPDFQCDDLQVIATAADFEEQLACSLREDRCRCFGVHERPGSYLVTVLTGDPPIELEERELEVEMDDANCHVETEFVTIRVRTPGAEPDAGAPDAGGGQPEPEPADAGG